jgi:hypothetical protein
MPDYEDTFARAVDQPAFSNGDEGYAWMDAWCARCVHDGYGPGLDEPQCPLLNVAMSGRTPLEWFAQANEDGAYRRDDQYHCVMFRDRDDPGGREPEPIPDPPGQLCLFPRAPCEGIRMYADTRPQASVPDEERLLWGSSARR